MLPSNVLVLCWEDLSHVVMASAVLEPLRRLWPSSTVGLWVRSSVAGLFTDDPRLDRLHVANPYWESSPDQRSSDRREFFNVLRDVAQQRYDVVLVLNADWRRSLACRWARIPWRVGVNQGGSRFFLNRLARRDPTLHMTEEHRWVLSRAAGEEIEELDPVLDVSEEDLRWADEWMARQLATARQPKARLVMALHPFDEDNQKVWPWVRWNEWVERVLTRHPDLHFWLAAPANDRDRIEKYFQPSQRLWWVDALSLGQWKALLRASTGLVAGDSGVGHMAAALGVPVLSLFGPGNPRRVSPRGARVVVLQKDPLTHLTVDEVDRAFQEWAFLPPAPGATRRVNP